MHLDKMTRPVEATCHGESNLQRENADKRASTVDTTLAGDGLEQVMMCLCRPPRRGAPHSHIRHLLQDRQGPRTGEEDGGITETLSLACNFASNT